MWFSLSVAASSRHMEKDASAQSDPTITTSSASPEQPPPPPPPHAPNSPPPAQSSSSLLNQQFAANFSALYHSIFPPKSPHSSSTIISPSLCSSASSDNNQNATARSTIAIEHRLNQARLVLEYQQLRDHYDLCRGHLNDLTEEIDLLRRENARLRLANSELVKLLNLPSQGTLQSCFRRLGLSDANATGSDFSSEDVCSYSPTSVMDQSGYETSNPERVWLPKSISVRSSGYLKLNQPPPSNSRSNRPVSQPRLPRAQEPAKVSLFSGFHIFFAICPLICEFALPCLIGRSQSLTMELASHISFVALHENCCYHDYAEMRL